MLHKDFGLSVKDVTDTGMIEGYGSVFGGTADAYGDIISKGAFTATIAKHKAEGTMPSMLWGHQTAELPIGDWIDMAEDRKGLYLKGQIDMDDPVGQRVFRALKRKSVRGLSIGYETVRFTMDAKRENVRHLDEIDLWEVSPVNFPAQPRAQITGVKCIVPDGALPTLPQFEEHLREVGFSKTQAAVIAGKGLSHLLRGEPGSASDADAWSAMLAGLSA